jgi:hypothetical protein
MAKLTPNGLSGSIGKITYYTINGVPCAKEKTVNINQTAATKASASKFGIASGCSRAIRDGLEPFITPMNNLDMRNRLTSAVYEWVLSKPEAANNSFVPVSTLNGFDFNIESALRKKFLTAIRADWSVPGRVTVAIPALDPFQHIKAPVGTSSVDIWVGFTNFRVDEPVRDTHRSTMLQVTYLQDRIVAPKEIEFNISELPNSLNVLAMGLRYNASGIAPGDKLKWLPAGIVEAWYRGE